MCKWDDSLKTLITSNPQYLVSHDLPILNHPRKVIHFELPPRKALSCRDHHSDSSFGNRKIVGEGQE